MKMHDSRRQLSRRLLALCLGTSAALIAPSAALGADVSSGPGTVRAAIGADGKVTSVKLIGTDGKATGFSGQLPVTMSVTHTASGTAQTYSYHVENTFSRTQTVHYTDTAGRERHTSVTLQLPLVAQLGVDVPASLKNLTATGATVTTDPDGTRHVLWDMVLFTPLGSSVQDVSFTATGGGNPVAQLRATPVNPTTAAGLSSKGQDKTAEFQQEDFWGSYAHGGNKGLKQLGDGVGQILDGLGQLLDGASQLHAGLAGSLSGTQQAADGSTQLAAGAKDLTAGLKLIHGGLSKNPTTGLTGGLALIHAGLSNNPATGLTGGLRQIHTGQRQLTSGLHDAHDGSTQITAGLDAIHQGQSDLTTGLAQINTGLSDQPGGLTNGLEQISGGLAQLNDPAAMPAAVAGLNQVAAGLQALSAGVGDDATPNTLLNGVAQVQGGLAQLRTGLQQSAGCAADIINGVIAGTAGGTADPCVTGGVWPAGLVDLNTADPVGAAILGQVAAGFAAVANGTDTTVTPGLDQLDGALALIHAGLTHPAGAGGATDPGGVREGLAALSAGVAQLQVGIGQAAGAIALLAPGAAQALDGSQQLLAGSATALDGSTQLTDGSADALAGSQQLTSGLADAEDGSQKLTDGSGKALAGSVLLLDGSGKALAGSRKLFSGSGDALDGSTQIRDGLALLSNGLVDGAKQFPEAVDGAGQIADGLAQVVPGEQQVKDGISQVLSGATGPLEQQLTQASRNAHQQIAVLNAAGGLTAEAPGGASTSYVLAQPGAGSFALAADTTGTKGSSHTGRNALLIALGGVVALAIGLGAGIAVGRQRVTA